MSAPQTIGIDLGGTKSLCGVVAADATILHSSRIGSIGLTSNELVDALCRQIELAVESHPAVEAVGLGVPCTIDRERGICVNAVNLDISNVPLGQLVSERVGLPAFLDNDGNVSALAEQRHGAAVGDANVVMLTIGTGIGGGLILGGYPFRGSTGAGAELGHIVVEIDGPRCQGNCPNRGCIETLASGTALLREARHAAANVPDSQLRRLLDSGELDGPAVTAAALAGDAAAVAVFELTGTRIGAALSGIANIFDPDRIVIGGGVIAAGELLLAPARRVLRERALPPQNQTPVVAATLGENAGMIGAATMARDELSGLEDPIIR